MTDLKNDQEAIQPSESTIEKLAKKIKNDKELITSIVRQNGYALQYASEELKNNREIVMEAVRFTGSSSIHSPDSSLLMKTIEMCKDNKELLDLLIPPDLKSEILNKQQRKENIKKSKEWIMATGKK